MAFKTLIQTICTCLVPMLCSVFFSTAHAELIWDFSFINSGQTVKPTDTVEMIAKLSNNSTAGEVIGFLPEDSVEDYFIKSASGNLLSLNDFYDFSFGSDGNLFDNLSQYILYPGDEIEFIFATHTPKGITPSGLYEDSGSMAIFPCGATLCSLIDSKNSSFQWNVSSIATVPLPNALFLFGFGLAGLGIFKRRQK